MSTLAAQILGLVLLLAGAIGAHELDNHHAVDQAYKSGQTEVMGRWTIEKNKSLATALEAAAASQAEERRRIENERFQARATAAAAAAGDAVGSLHKHVDVVVAAGASGGERTGDSTPAIERQAAATLGALLNDSAERHRALGIEADQAAAAADDCAARYDALTTR